MHYKNSLPLKLIDIHYVLDCINFKVRIGEKLCSFFNCVFLTKSVKRQVLSKDAPPP